MDTFIQAVIMGVVQGLTEFLPVSSSGHLIVVPFLFGWHDPFLTSLAFSVMLHIGTLCALLVYFRADWLRLVPAGLAAVRDRSLRGDPDRRLAWSPREDRPEGDMDSIDLRAAADEISARFLGASGAAS